MGAKRPDRLMPRCTDEVGQVQPSPSQVAERFERAPDPTYSVPGLDNTIQPWRHAPQTPRSTA